LNVFFDWCIGGVVRIVLSQSGAFGLLERVRLRSSGGLGVTVLHAATLLWASTFLVVKDAVSSVPPSVLILARFTLAALVFAPFLRRSSAALNGRAHLQLWLAGLENAVWFTLIYATQSIGLQSSSASRSAFISVLYVALVPLVMRFSGRRVRLVEWLAVLVAVLGIWLLTAPSGQAASGDAWVFSSVIFGAIQLVRLEVLSVRFASWPLTAVTVCCGVILSLVWLAFDVRGLHLELLGRVSFPWWQVVYLGVIVTGLGTWLMAFGQARVSGVRTAMIFALEPVWAALLAAVLGERLGLLGWCGGVLVVAANVLPNLLPNAWLTSRSKPWSESVPLPEPKRQRWRLENTRNGSSIEFSQLSELRRWLEREPEPLLLNMSWPVQDRSVQDREVV
jgi:drug/metabolite transporter (DMT)-like permease